MSSIMRMKWESDFEDGGTEWYVDGRVDVVYFAGHGSPLKFHFGVDHDTQGDYPYMVYAPEAKWGDWDGDLEWVVLHACQCLHESYYTGWYYVFEGVHGIFGFHTITRGANLGDIFAGYILQGLPALEAWQRATKDAFPSYVYAAIYRAAIRIDTFVIDYADEPVGAGWSDYGDPYVYLYGLRYTKWAC